MKDNKIFKLVIFAELDLDDPRKIPNANGFVFSIPNVLERDDFFDHQNDPSKMSVMFITKLLVEALSGNIHASHQKGYVDSAEHLRHAIGMLEDLFVANCKVDFSQEEKKKWIDKLKKNI